LVWVDTHLPFVLSGNQADQYSGMGLVIDAERGLVLVDRDTVPQSLADVSVIVGGAARVAARPVYFHPEHNLAVIQFDPSLVPNSGLTSATFARRAPTTGDAVWQVGLSGRQELLWGPTHVSGFRPFTLGNPSVPQYRDLNLDLVTFADAPLERGGVVVDRRGDVMAFLASFVTGAGKTQAEGFRGLMAQEIVDVVDALRAGKAPPDRTLGVAWAPLALSTAVDRGLPPAEAALLQKSGAARILTVTDVAPASGAGGKLRAGDLLLAVGGKPTASWRTLELAARQTHVALRVWRDNAAVDLFVPTTPAPTGDLDRAFVWAGAALQDPPAVLGLQRGVVPDGAYVAWRWAGGPADRYGMDPTSRIVAVDGVAVHDLASFERAVAGRPDGAPVRLDIRDLDDRERVVTLRLDLDYWPAARLERGPAGWTRTAAP
jgi:S1-C subfamily serine protease